VNVSVEAPNVSVVNESPEIRVDVPSVTVQPAEVTVVLPEPERSRFAVRRDSKGYISEIVEG
jgi:hypothetical protein